MESTGRIQVLIEIALTVALSAVLHFVKVWQMPQGGSVSLEMLPLFVLALRRGVGPGIVAGALFGIIDLFLEPIVVHWAQFLLDYPIAFGACGLAGLFAPAWHRAVHDGRAAAGAFAVAVPAVALGAAARYVAHLVSGAIFFGQYAGVGQSAWAYSAIYNLYVPISAVACVVAIGVVLPALERVVPSAANA